MAIRTTIVGITNNEDGTYSEKEIHPFTDMNAVVSLKAVDAGNYDAYTNLPLEGAPQNVLTAFLNTRSYLYSLRNFKNKTVTDNYTESTDSTIKVPSMQALKDAYNSCKSIALDGINSANANAETRIPKANITNDYRAVYPDNNLVLSQTGASVLWNNLNNGKISKDNITNIYLPDTPVDENYVLNQVGAKKLYADSLAKSIVSMILSAPYEFLTPIFFSDSPIKGGLSKEYVISVRDASNFRIRTITQREVSSYVNPTIEFFKITLMSPSNTGDSQISNLNRALDSKWGNTNDIFAGKTEKVYRKLSGEIDGDRIQTKAYENHALNREIIVQETVIIAIIYVNGSFPVLVELYNSTNDRGANNFISFNSHITSNSEGIRVKEMNVSFSMHTTWFYTVERYYNKNLNTNFVADILHSASVNY